MINNSLKNRKKHYVFGKETELNFSDVFIFIFCDMKLLISNALISILICRQFCRIKATINVPNFFCIFSQRNYIPNRNRSTLGNQPNIVKQSCWMNGVNNTSIWHLLLFVSSNQKCFDQKTALLIVSYFFNGFPNFFPQIFQNVDCKWQLLSARRKS